MADTPKRKPRKPPLRPGPATDTGSVEVHIPLDAATHAELRAHWPRGRLEPDDLRRHGEALYGKSWRTEIAKDLVAFRVDGKGGRRSGEALSHAIVSRWLAGGKDGIPPWVLAALPDLPAAALERHRRDAAAAETAVRARLDEAQRAWIREWVPRHMPSPPILLLPAAPAAAPGAVWPSPTQDDIEHAEDMGKQAYDVAAKLSDDDASTRPADPVLRAIWDAAWVQANADHQEAHKAHVAKLQTKAVARS